MPTPTREALWVLRAQCGDQEALELLLQSVEASLRRYLRGLVGAADADDVLQDVLILIYRNLTWLERSELFRPWAFRIASRSAHRHLKRRKRRFEREEDSAQLAELPAPAGRPSDGLLRELVHSDAISPASRGVLVLHFQEEMSLPEIAAILEVPLGTAKSRLAYGLAALRKQLIKRGSI